MPFHDGASLKMETFEIRQILCLYKPKQLLITMFVNQIENPREKTTTITIRKIKRIVAKLKSILR